MKIKILIICTLFISFNINAQTNVNNLEEKCIKSISDYYDYLNKKDFNKAYDKSNKKVDFETYKSWYVELKNIYISDIKKVSDDQYNVDVVLVENDIKNVYRYDVTFTMDNEKIINSNSKDISNTVNSSRAYKSIIGRKFRNLEYYETQFGKFVFNEDNTFYYMTSMGEAIGYFYVIDDKIYLKDHGLISTKSLTFHRKKDSFISTCKIVSDQFNGDGWWSDEKPKPGSKIDYNGHSVTTVNDDKYDFDLLGTVFKDFDDQQVYKISLLETYNYVTFRSLENIIKRNVLGYTIYKNKKYFLVAASYSNADPYDEIGTIKYYTAKSELKELGNYLGWVHEDYIIKGY